MCPTVTAAGAVTLHNSKHYRFQWILQNIGIFLVLKASLICLPGLRKMKRCTLCKRYSVNSCQERSPSFTFHILSVHQFMLLKGYLLLQYLSQYCASFTCWKHPELLIIFQKYCPVSFRTVCTKFSDARILLWLLDVCFHLMFWRKRNICARESYNSNPTRALSE